MSELQNIGEDNGQYYPTSRILLLWIDYWTQIGQHRESAPLVSRCAMLLAQQGALKVVKGPVSGA